MVVTKHDATPRDTRAGNEPSQSLKFHNHWGLLMVESAYKHFQESIKESFKNPLRHYAKQALTHGKWVLTPLVNACLA